MPRQLTRLTGITLTGSGYTIIAPTAYELAIYRLAGLRTWISPEARFEALGSRKGLRERITLADIPPYDAASGYALGSSTINGQPTLDLASAGSVKTALVATGASLAAMGLGYLAAGYTKVTVLKKPSDGLLMPLGSLDGGGGFLRLMGSAGYNGRLEIGHASTTVVTTGASYLGASHVVLASWDAASKAVVIEVDGVAQPQSAATISETPTPGSATKFALGGWDVEGSSFANGSIGEYLIFDRPLAASANASTKFALYAQLSAKYGITLPTS